MGKDKKNKKSKKKGRKDSDSSTPQSSVPSVDDETQELLQRGAHGTSQSRKSKSPQKSTSLAKSSILGKETPYECLAETPSTAPLSHPVPGVSHLDVPGPECGAAKARSPPKMSFFSQIKNKISPKKKSPNKLDSQCKCENKRRHMPDCPEWNKLKTDAEHNSPSRPSDTNSRGFGENSQSSNSSNPIIEGSDNVELRRTSRNDRLSVPRNSAVTSSPPRRHSLSRVKVSPGKKMAAFFPVSDCNCADKCNHDKGCPEKSQEIDVKLEDAKISISSARNASPTILRDNEDGDVNNASSTAEIKVKRRERTAESYFEDRSTLNSPEEKSEEEIGETDVNNASSTAEITVKRERTTESYFEDRSTLNSPEEKSKEEIVENLDLVYESLSREHWRYRANRIGSQNIEKASETNEETEMSLERLDEFGLHRERSRSVTTYVPLMPPPKVKNCDKDDLEVKGATGWSNPSTGKNKKLLRQDAVDVHDQSDTEQHCTDQYDERRRQRAQLTSAPGRSVPFIGQADPRSDRDTQLGATAASSVGSEIPSSRLGARPKTRNVVKKARDVGCSPSRAIGSNQSVIQSKLQTCQSRASGQSSQERCRSDPSVIPLTPMVCRSPASAQPLTTPPRTDPSTIQNEQIIDGSADNSQPIVATVKERPLPQLTEDDVQSLAGATGISESLRRHQSAPPRVPSSFGTCQCGHGYVHPLGCSRVIRARRKRTERRCKQEVEIIDYIYKKWEEKE